MTSAAPPPGDPDPLDGQVLCELLAGEPLVVAAYQYGSSLRDDFRAGLSDVDILLVVTDDSPVPAFLELVTAVQAVLPVAEVTLLRHTEVRGGLHPGWSRHYFVNVARSGIRLTGPDLLGDVAPACWEEALRRLTQLTQRSRLIVANPSKQREAAFWLGKYQQWVPLCLMELLDLHGIREDQLRQAHATFTSTFPAAADPVTYPYSNLPRLHLFLEQLTNWATEQRLLGTGCCAPTTAGPAHAWH